ncbi:SWF or SNF family helicase [Streptomyces sp. DSM 44915]|uniref:SWF or SNF family helicase n=1 Tax=Streptomyces chisholmiae TaxID=3075540 RepID=A0ABU2JMR9_9ACTN|nr:SWF or SNF family helicase [Streptomyces sp. DSM 44915]MDT0266031.1 SWF or SNF family helicase [Streptomyces sp. DSM 44915]
MTDEVVLAPLPPARGRGFAGTWWGLAWLRALEDGALDTERLRQGRRHARAGAVGAVSVRPGRLTSVVRTAGEDARRADVLLRPLDAAEWDRLLETAAREAGHLAALLDAELPPALVADAAAAGVELLPGIGDLEPTCECGEWDHCAHTAALCYQTARLLDADPFLLLRLRGLGQPQLLAELRRRSTARAAAAGPAEPAGVPAAEAYARPVPALPAPPAVAGPPGPVPGLATPGVAGEPDVAALEFLAGDAARRAGRLLAQALAAGHAERAQEPELERWPDAVRMAADGAPPPGVARRLAAGCGRGGVELALAVAAWRVGGARALAVLEAADEGPDPRAAEQLALAFADVEPRPVLRGTGNRWTVRGADVQLRYGAGRWWPYRRRRGRWWPAGPAEPDPVTALAAARDGESWATAGPLADAGQASDSKTA